MGQSLAMLTTAMAGFGLTWLVQSSALLALGLLAGRVVKRSGPAVQSAVYRTTLAAVLICPIASAVLAASGLDGWMLRLPVPAQAAQGDPIAVAPAEAIVPAAAAERPERPMPPSGASPVSAAPAAAAPLPHPSPLPPARRAAPSTPSWSMRTAVPLGVSVWLLGSVVLGLRLLAGQWRMDRVRAASIPAEADAKALCRALAEGMRLRPPAVLRSPFLFSPCLDGLRDPAILLPEDVRDNLRETFVHELAHLARRDGPWNLLRRSAESALWVQPLLWVLSRRLEVTAEEVCDDFVVHQGADRARYAGHLLELAGRALPPVAPAGVGMVSFRSLLGRRVVRILDPSRSLSLRAGGRAVLAALVVGIVGTALAGLLGVGEAPRQARAQAPTKADAPKPAEAAAATRPDVPIHGRIVDLEGRPVAGVSVKLGGVQAPKSGDLTAWIEGVKKGEPPWIAYRHLGGDDVNLPETVRRRATTDRDGRFRFEGLGSERVVGLTIEGERVAYTTIDVVTRKAEPFPARGFPDTHGPGAQTIYGADFTFTASPGRPIEGLVIDAKTQRPLAGVAVQSWRFSGSDFVDTRRLRTVTDEQGRFRLVGMPKGKANAIIAIPADGQPYFMREASVGDPPGIAPVSVTIELHRGVMITGKVTDKANGKPVEGARLHYLPFLDNRFAQAFPEFDRNGNVDGFQTRYTTRADGTYELVGLPGRAIVGVEGVGKTPYRNGVGSETIPGLGKNGHYKTWSNPIMPGRSWPNTLIEIDPAEGTETVRVDAQLDPGLTLRIQVVDADGKPVPDATVSGSDRLRAGEAKAGALFDLKSFRPDEVRSVVVRHEGRKLGKVVRLRAGDDADGPVVVALAPSAAIHGRVVDADGSPVPGATVRVDVEPTEGFIHQLTSVGCDREGRFEVPNVPTGCEYGLVAESGTMLKQRKVAFGKATVRPGETTDVGAIGFKND